MTTAIVSEKQSLPLLLIEENLEYFRKFYGNSNDLIKICADVVVSKTGKKLRGIKFPLALIIETLMCAEKFDETQKIIQLKNSLLSFLAESYEQSGFNYFEAAYLPNDLDTASMLARLLGKENKNLRINYEKVVSRNRLTAWVTSTWLDISDYKSWFVGDKPFHMDVLLNHWLTEFEFGRYVDRQIILQITNNLGLRNYWYLPPLYTTYLYCRLICRMGLDSQEEFTRPVIEKMKSWKENPSGSLKTSNICSYPKINKLVESQSLSSWLNYSVEYGINRYLGNRLLLTELNLNNVEFSEVKSLKKWRSPIYWSLGLTGFSSEPVNRAIALMSLIEFDKTITGATTNGKSDYC